ncbi:TPA: hypothetical protein SG772_001648 [Campylobacter coli]|nr:hypothetical protein [Campylobacter coli]HEH5091040.1 hypothetical protein [Campylobacter coli]
MILEICSYNAKFFLTFSIEKHSQVAFAVKDSNIEIIHNGITHQVKTYKKFEILLNAICGIREKIDESFDEKDKSLVLDIDEIIAESYKI